MNKPLMLTTIVGTVAISVITLPALAEEIQTDRPSFSELDLDRDGQINVAESKRYQWLSDNFTIIDADKNGMVSQDEYARVTK